MKSEMGEGLILFCIWCLYMVLMRCYFPTKLGCVIGDLFTDGFIGVLCKLNLILLPSVAILPSRVLSKSDVMWLTHTELCKMKLYPVASDVGVVHVQ